MVILMVKRLTTPEPPHPPSLTTTATPPRTHTLTHSLSISLYSPAPPYSSILWKYIPGVAISDSNCKKSAPLSRAFREAQDL
jgi:hypothetical protein